MLDNESNTDVGPSDHTIPGESPPLPEDNSENVPENDPGNIPEDDRQEFIPTATESDRTLSGSPDPLLWLEELEQKVDCDLQSLIYDNEAGIPYRIPFIDAAVLKKVFSWEFQNDLDSFLSNGEDNLHIATAQLINCASGVENTIDWSRLSNREASPLNNHGHDVECPNTSPETGNETS